MEGGYGTVGLELPPVGVMDGDEGPVFEGGYVPGPELGLLGASDGGPVGSEFVPGGG